MLEMSDIGGGLYNKSFAGDTFNMAHYLNLVANGEIQVDSFCRKHGVVTTSIANATLRIHAAPNAIRDYTFALGVTRFQLCARCGTYVAAISEFEGVQYAVVVANVLECRPKLDQPVSPMVYDDENPDTRLQRRSERWAKLIG